MSYEVFLQGPEVYVPVILISLVLTMAAYGAYPLIIARIQEETITKRKYKVRCYCVNFLVNVLFIIINGKSSGSAYLLWTWIFSGSGVRTLRRRGVLEGTQPFGPVKTPTYQESEEIGPKVLEGPDTEGENFPISEKRLQIRFCRKCGFELIAGSDFCSRCGIPVERE